LKRFLFQSQVKCAPQKYIILALLLFKNRPGCTNFKLLKRRQNLTSKFWLLRQLWNPSLVCIVEHTKLKVPNKYFAHCKNTKKYVLKSMIYSSNVIPPRTQVVCKTLLRQSSDHKCREIGNSGLGARLNNLCHTKHAQIYGE